LVDLETEAEVDSDSLLHSIRAAVAPATVQIVADA
jgi:hypothetical protein